MASPTQPRRRSGRETKAQILEAVKGTAFSFG